MTTLKNWMTLVVWLVAASPAAAAESVSGVVRDATGAPVADVEIVLLTAERASVARGQSDAQGRFSLAVPAPGRYLLVATAPRLGEARLTVTVGASAPPPLEVVLDVAALREDVTVTASPNVVEDLRVAGQPVNLIDSSDIEARVHTVVAQAVEGETGVALQRTSPTMAGVFVRGLTGNKVNVFVDGVRYSNGAQRGGVNTFLDLIEPDSLESIEVVRGPSSAQYGSDALGGSVQFLSRPPQLSAPGTTRWGGTIGVGGGTAHRAVNGQAFVSYMAPSIGITGSLSGRNVGAVRPGDGIDSHAAVTRFFGIASDVLMDERLPDTGFDQVGGSLRAQWAPSAATRTVFAYTHTNQNRGKRYDQLLGGDGNLIADLNDLSLDLFSARYERLGAGFFDHATVTYSLNSQREERVNQGGNGNPAATIGHEPERTTVHGLQGTATTQLSARQTLSVGGDVYFEGLSSDSFNVNPVTGAVSPRRPRVPDGATFTQGGVFAQTAYDLRPDRVRLLGAVRVGGASYEAKASDSPIVNGAPLWPDDALTAGSVTFRAGAVFTPSEPWTFSASLSRGFRAPHMTDLGTLGLTGAGFEVSAPDVAGLGGFVGSTADASAVSTGDPVEQLRSETSLQYEGSAGYRRKSWRTDLTVFTNYIYDNIQKQALILPQGAVGRSSAGSRSSRRTPTASCSLLRRRCRCSCAPTSTTRGSGASSTPCRPRSHRRCRSARRSPISAPWTRRPTCRRTSKAERPRRTPSSQSAGRRPRVGGSSRTSTSPGARRTSRRSISAIAAPAPAAPAPRSAPSSRTARAPAAGSARVPTAPSDRQTTCCWRQGRHWPRSRTAFWGLASTRRRSSRRFRGTRRSAFAPGSGAAPTSSYSMPRI